MLMLVLTRWTDLNEVLALWLGDKRLQLRSGERVDVTGFGDDEKKDLTASEN